MSQFDLFARKAEIEPNPYTPEPDNIRARLTRILEEARAADVLPWEPSKARMYENIFPQMTNWLPADEADRWRAEFTTEMARLNRAVA